MNKVRTFYTTCFFILVSCLYGNAQESGTSRYNRSQLIQHAASICIAGNNDEAACGILSNAAREFDIQVLEEYATLLRHRRLDIKNEKVIAATAALLSKAEKEFGKETMEAARCRRACIIANNETNLELSIKLSDENVNIAKRLYEQETDNWKNEEFYLLCRLENILLKENRDAENPLLYAEAYEIEVQTDSLYRIHEEDTEEKVDIYQYMAYIKPTFSSFSNYLSTVYQKLFPNDTRIPSMLYNNGLPSNALGYYEGAVEMANRMFGENDIRTLDAEKNLQSFKCDNDIESYDEIYVKLKDIEKRLVAQLHPDDSRILYVRKAMWECNIRSGKRMEETNGFLDYLNKMKTYYGEYSQPYLYCLYEILYQRQRVDIGQASILLEELKKIADEIYKDDMISLAQTYAITGDVALGQHDIAIANEHISKAGMAFEKSIADFKTGKRPLTWKAVLVARRLCELYSTTYEKEKLFKTMQYLIKMEESLANKAPTVYVVDLLDYSYLLARSEKYDEALQTCEQAKTIFQAEGMSCSRVYYDRLSIYDAKKDIITYQNTAREAIKATEGEDDWNCYFKLLLASTMHTESGMTGEGKVLMEEAYKQFLTIEDSMIGIFFDGYFIISNYLQWEQRFEEAEKLLLRGLDRYNAIDGHYSDMFTRFLTEIVSLYKDVFEDYDKAESFLEGHLQRILGDPSNMNHDLTLQLLWTHYNLLTTKSNNDTKIIYLMQLMIKEATILCNQANNEEDNKRLKVEYLLPIFVEWANYWIPQIDHYEKEIGNMSPTSTYAQYQQAMIHKMEELRSLMRNISASFVELEKSFQAIYPDYINMSEYINLIKAASQLSLHIDRDTIQAEAWLKKGLQSTNKSILYLAYYQLADFYMKTGKYQNAITHYQETMRLMEEIQYLAFSTQTISYFNENLGAALYKNGQYDDAIDYATKYYHLQQELLGKNIDLMTQAEREDYLAKNGVGNTLLLALLPHNPQRLSTDIYNSILKEKGFLLRASERIHNAIIHSDNVELKNALDSLNRMNDEFKKLEFSKADYVNFNLEYNPEAIRLQQQIEQLERNINREVKNTTNIKDETVTWEEVRNALGNTDMAIEFVFSDSILGALMVKKDFTRPQYIPLCNSLPIMNWLTEKANMDARERAEALYLHDELKLYANIWQPLEKHLDGIKNVYFSPSGYLNTLSLGAVRCPDGTCMMDHYILHQLTSTAQLTQAGKSSSTTKKQAALFGAVYYSEEQRQDDEEFIAMRSRNNDTDNTPLQLIAQRGAVDESFPFLPFTRNEVENIEELFENHHVGCDTRFGQEASERQFRQMSRNSPYILHLATHGFFIDTEEKVMQNTFLSQFPATRFQGMQRAGMALAGASKTWEEGNPDTDGDGILTAAEVAALNLDNTRLAVLSACNTGVGFFSNEGVYGMYRGFKQAGVKSILSSLWTVNDFSTSRLIQQFYTKWMEGMTMQQAYQQAVSDIRRDFPSPYYWAPFVLIDAIE